MPKKENQAINDQQLWADFKEGSHDAYTQLIKQYYRPMFTYAIRLHTDRDFVKDCVQDVFYELWRRRETLGMAESVKSYLFAAIRFKVYREQKKWNKHDPLSDDYDFDAEVNIETRMIEDHETAELKQKLELAINKLPARQREILFLRFYENLDQDAIARVMQLNKQVVYNLLHKAIVRLRKEWFVFIFLLTLSSVYTTTS